MSCFLTKSENHDQLVLVTGVSGYVASHVADQLLKAGYKVRGTVRSLKNEARVKPVRALGPIELVEADLLDPDCWKNIVKDCHVVMHVASPFPIANPNHEDEILKPAVDGTLNVLKACVGTKVKRVVVTSSEAAVMGAIPKNDYTYSEKDWGDSNTDFTYVKSKILAEKAAWDFVAEKKKRNEPVFELAVVNPSLVFGPMILDATGTSLDTFIGLFNEKLEKIMEYYLPMCDVRDVGLAHVRAGFLPEAAGKRFIIVSEKKFISLKQCADIVRKHFPQYNLPTEEEPGYGLGKTAQTDDSNLRNILCIKPTNFEKTIIDMTNSLVQKGLIKKMK